MKVAVSIDEVLTNMLPALQKHYKRTRRSSSKIRSVQQRKYLYKDIFGMSEKESKWLVYSFWNSEEAESMVPIKRSQTVLQDLKDNGHSLTVVTGRQSYSKKCTENFIKDYYSDIFDDMIFVNSYSLCGPSVSKHKVCEDIGADFLIDSKEYNGLGNTIPLHYVGHPQDCLKLYGTSVYPWCLESRSTLKMTDWNRIGDFFLDGILPPLRPEKYIRK